MNKQDKLLTELTEVIKDDVKCQALETFLSLIQNNSLQVNLNKFNELQQNNDEIEKAYKEISEILKAVKKSQENIDKIYDEIYNIENDNKTKSSQALRDIQDAQNKAKTMQESYNGFYDIKDSQGNVTQGIISKLQEACKQIEQNKDNIVNFKAFYNKIFEGEKDENGKTTTPALGDFLETQTNKLEQLMGDATSYGLATAYAKEKKEIQKSIKWWNRVFVASIVVFIGVSVIYFMTSWEKGFTTLSFLRTLPFFIFGGFFTYYSTKQIAEYKRIANEYAHKETLNTTYIQYQKQVAQIKNNEELTKQLLKIMLDSAEFNPSKVLSNKGEVPSLSILEKIIDMLPIDVFKKLKEYIISKPKID